jgi:polysaccharide export outer membrane protein
MQRLTGTGSTPIRVNLYQKGTGVVLKQMVRLILACFFASLVAAPAALQAQPAGGGTVASPYRINPGDQLDILVWGDERLQRSVLVLPDGTFAFPLVGHVSAAGRLPIEIERVITAGLQPQYKGPVPQVTVSVAKASGYQFSVVGKVRNPGTFTPGRYVNALEALAIAGGPSEFANTGGARVIRKSGDGLFVVPVRLGDALKGDTGRLGTADIPRIESGDTLVVP